MVEVAVRNYKGWSQVLGGMAQNDSPTAARLNAKPLAPFQRMQVQLTDTAHVGMVLQAWLTEGPALHQGSEGPECTASCRVNEAAAACRASQCSKRGGPRDER